MKIEKHFFKTIMLIVIFIGFTIGLTACSFEPTVTELVKNRYKNSRIVFQATRGTINDYLICQEKNLIFVRVDSTWPISISKEAIIGGVSCE